MLKISCYWLLLQRITVVNHSVQGNPTHHVHQRGKISGRRGWMKVAVLCTFDVCPSPRSGGGDIWIVYSFINRYRWYVLLREGVNSSVAEPLLCSVKLTTGTVPTVMIVWSFWTIDNVYGSTDTWVRIRINIPNSDPDPKGHWIRIKYGPGSGS